jgi:hypothetical protein
MSKHAGKLWRAFVKRAAAKALRVRFRFAIQKKDGDVAPASARSVFKKHWIIKD